MRGGTAYGDEGGHSDPGVRIEERQLMAFADCGGRDLGHGWRRGEGGGDGIQALRGTNTTKIEVWSATAWIGRGSAVSAGGVWEGERQSGGYEGGCWR